MDKISFCGGETAGSVGKRQIYNLNRDALRIQPSQTGTTETINFKGNYTEESTMASNIAKTALGGVMLFGALGYAHKAGYINKIKNTRLRSLAENITEPCHLGCSKIKEFGLKMFKA